MLRLPPHGPRAHCSPRAALALFTLLGGLSIGLLGHALPAAAESDCVIRSGARGGYYHGVANRLTTVLKQEGIDARHEASEGSLANLERLTDPDDPTNVVLVQADALRHHLDAHPTQQEGIVVLDDLGRECVVLITPAEGGIATAADLKTGRFGALAIPDPRSGPSITWEYMSRMDPSYRKTPTIARDPLQVLLDMRRPGSEKIAALMLVKRPRTLSTELEIVLDNQEAYRIAAVRPEDVRNGALPDGSPVYSFDEVRTGAGIDYQVTWNTMCTRALMLASSSKLDDAKRRELARVLLQWRTLIAPGR